MMLRTPVRGLSSRTIGKSVILNYSPKSPTRNVPLLSLAFPPDYTGIISGGVIDVLVR